MNKAAINNYQQESLKSQATFYEHESMSECFNCAYLGLVSAYAAWRDKGHTDLSLLGQVVWYHSKMCSVVDFNLADIYNSAKGIDHHKFMIEIGLLARLLNRSMEGRPNNQINQSIIREALVRLASCILKEVTLHHATITEVMEGNLKFRGDRFTKEIMC